MGSSENGRAHQWYIPHGQRGYRSHMDASLVAGMCSRGLVLTSAGQRNRISGSPAALVQSLDYLEHVSSQCCWWSVADVSAGWDGTNSVSLTQDHFRVWDECSHRAPGLPPSTAALMGSDLTTVKSFTRLELRVCMVPSSGTTFRWTCICTRLGIAVALYLAVSQDSSGLYSGIIHSGLRSGGSILGSWEVVWIVRTPDQLDGSPGSSSTVECGTG
ncbi:putative exonuclease [Pseudomonas phage PIP]|nr:putative exonuclease [Pseudomonas phage PIP]